MSVFIVAEAGVNHLGDRSKMLALCDAAKNAGADAVKFQAFCAQTLMERRGMVDKHGRATDMRHGDTISLLRKTELTDADLDAIAAHCKSIGIKWFASVFDPSQVERVLSRGACALKIGHAENEYKELISECQRAVDHYAWRIADADRIHYPLYVSYQIGHDPYSTPMDVTRVMCVAEYPATSPSELREVIGFGQCWGDESAGFLGFSSHYRDYRIPAAAALRGAEYIEAHLCLDTINDPEARWSLTPAGFWDMVKLIREYESWL